MKRWIHANTYNGFNESEFDERQLGWINYGLKKGLDISYYADPKFKFSQMAAIVRGLEDGVDVSQYADPKFDMELMDKIRMGLNYGVDAHQYNHNKSSYNRQLWESIKQAVQSGEKSLKDIQLDFDIYEAIARAAARIDPDLHYQGNSQAEVDFYDTSDSPFVKIGSISNDEWNSILEYELLRSTSLRDFAKSVVTAFEDKLGR